MIVFKPRQGVIRCPHCGGGELTKQGGSMTDAITFQCGRCQRDSTLHLVQDKANTRIEWVHG